MEIGKFEDIRSYEPNTNEYTILLDYDELMELKNNDPDMLTNLVNAITNFLGENNEES